MQKYLWLCGLLLAALIPAAPAADDAAAREDARKIAEKAGLANWDKVERLEFAFNVERDGKVTTRVWSWEPKARKVRSVDQDKTFSQDDPDRAKKLDGQFINDGYWLLFPFHLVWDSGMTLAKAPEKVPSPIAGTPHWKLTVQYGSEGGYTPGDAYDLFYDDDFVIREWTFRKGGAEKPTLSTTWEGYQDIGGLMISTEHKGGGGFRIYFDQLSVTSSASVFPVTPTAPTAYER